MNSTLGTIIKNLEELEKQNRFLLVVFRDLNKSKIDDCLGRLASALETFNVSTHCVSPMTFLISAYTLQISNDLRQTNILQNIQLRLQRIEGVTENVADDVGVIKVTLQQVLAKLDNATAHCGSKNLARQQMPLKPRIFRGRDSLVREIAEFLCHEETSRVCVLGPGGMGKTSLSLAVVESPITRGKYASSHCFWVPCIEASSASVFLQLLHLHLRISRVTDDILEDILSELNKSEEPRLILLDNFETPWNTVDETRKTVSDTLCQLSKLRHVGILVTMRGADPPCDDIEWQKRHIRNIDKESARFIFHEIHPKSKDDPDVDTLLAALGFMPFAVTLMARLGRKSLSSAKDLLNQWSEDGTDMISSSRSAEENMNRSISLSIDLLRQDSDAISLLETLSLLPGGTTRTNLGWWIQNLRASAIAALSDAALLQSSNESATLFVLPVVQAYMSKRIPDAVHRQVQEACCQYILDHACRYHDPRFKAHSEKLAAEDTNIQSLLLASAPHVPLDPFFEALHCYTWYRFETQPSTSVAQRALDLARASKNDHYVAKALTALGATCRRLSRFEFALQCLEEALALFDNLPVIDPMAVECCVVIAECKLLLALSQPNPSIASFVRDTQSKYGHLLDDFGRARLLKLSGWCLSGDILHDPEVLGPLHEALRVFLRDNQLSDALESLTFIAEHYYYTYRYAEGLAVIDGARDTIEQAHDRVYLAYTHLTRGMILVNLGRHMEAHTEFEYSLLAYEYVGSHLGIAQTLECLGCIYMARGDYQDASSAYEHAKKVYADMAQRIPTVQDGIKRCNWNLAAIKKKEQRPEENIRLIMVGRHPPQGSQ